MYNRLKEIKAQHEHGKKTDFFGQTLHPKDIDWLIEQAEKVERYEIALKFYANKESHELWDEAEKADLTEFINDIDFDGGDRAKKALELKN